MVLGDTQRGFALDRREAVIEIGIAIEIAIGSISENLDNDPDPDPDPDFDVLDAAALLKLDASAKMSAPQRNSRPERHAAPGRHLRKIYRLRGIDMSVLSSSLAQTIDGLLRAGYVAGCLNPSTQP